MEGIIDAGQTCLEVFHPGYHRFSKPWAAIAAPIQTDKARNIFMPKCSLSGRGVRVQERRSQSFPREQNERKQQNRSERVLTAVSGRESERRRKGNWWAETE